MTTEAKTKAKTEWTDDLRAQVIKTYEDLNPTPENSTELVKQIAETTETTVNGVRAILHRAGVYVKKEPAKASEGKTPTTGTRVNKAEAVTALKAAIESGNLPMDEDIISKLTGKAAAYITTLLVKPTKEE